MVSKIVKLETTVVNSEYDENNLIKEHQPFYNVMLKDDKTYPWICIKTKNFPRIFWPEPSLKMELILRTLCKVRPAKILLETIKNLYKIRSCNLDLAPQKLKMENISLSRISHQNCKGPCEGLESLESYDEKIDAIRGIIKGDFRKRGNI